VAIPPLGKQPGGLMELVKSDSYAPLQYLVTCAFTKEIFLVTPEIMFSELTEDGEYLSVFAYVGKKLIFSGLCTNVRCLNENLVKKLPKVRIKE
jgi:hypothetical protein